ncbi:PepSY domain-containing protein [Variovorax paradoxus]|uniref:PepSY domain-containing protein n=1 Tax=Variovorax paradoxus TaxID=34073 RepID=UPI00247AE43B
MTMPTWRQAWFQLHWLLGITAGSVLLVIGLSGAVLSFREELIDALNPGGRHVAVQDKEALAPPQLLAAVREAFPGRQVGTLALFAEPGAAARVIFAPRPGERRGDTVYLDPYAGRPLPPLMGAEFFEWVEALHRWLLLPRERAVMQPGAWRPRVSATLHWDTPALAVARFDKSDADATALCNALHAAGMAGAMARVLELTTAYAQDRRQFGRPIAQFQAIQQELAVLAEQAHSATLAARLGCSAEGWQPDALLAAVAKLRACEAARGVAAIAHAVFGAIGITEEHVLGLYTRRLHEWRQAPGTEAQCARLLGEAVLARPEGLLYAVRLRLAAAVHD